MKFRARSNGMSKAEGGIKPRGNQLRRGRERERERKSVEVQKNVEVEKRSIFLRKQKVMCQGLMMCLSARSGSSGAGSRVGSLPWGVLQLSGLGFSQARRVGFTAGSLWGSPKVLLQHLQRLSM